jgi:NAD(P)-dependent dehydrogenase (short-subunit alcohol dehydrogenase family)
MTTPAGGAGTPPRVALVTGANKGIGRAIAAGLLRESFMVYLGARDAARGAEAAAGLAGAGDVRLLQLDVTAPESVAAAAAQITTETGHLDVLVNNAGVSTAGRRRLDRMPKPSEETAEDMRFVYETNVFAVVTMINAFLPLLHRSPAGRIVNVTSMRGSIGDERAWVGQPDMAYSSSKTALNAVTVHFARELAGTPIKVNGAAPGHVATDFNQFRGARTPDQGAVVAIWLATQPADGPTGAVFQDQVQLAW